MATSKNKSKKGNKPSGHEKPATRAKFIEWCALPEQLRKPETAGEFAKDNKVNQATLSRWRHAPDFEAERIKLTKRWMSDKMPTVLHALYAGVVKNKRGADAKVLLQYVEDWVPKEALESDLAPGLAKQVEDLRVGLRDMIAAVRDTK